MCLAVLAGPHALAARQMNARDEPTVEGQLTLAGDQCNDQTLKADGKPVIKVSFCIFFYQFDSLFEIDAFHDYGVAWAQATFDALPGYCASELSFYIELSEGTDVLQQTPAEPFSAKRPASVHATILATADSHAVEAASVSQGFRLLPGKMAPYDGDETRVGVSWKGRSRAKLAFATGAEITWPSLESPEMNLGADTIKLTSGKGC